MLQTGTAEAEAGARGGGERGEGEKGDTSTPQIWAETEENPSPTKELQLLRAPTDFLTFRRLSI